MKMKHENEDENDEIIGAFCHQNGKHPLVLNGQNVLSFSLTENKVKSENKQKQNGK